MSEENLETARRLLAANRSGPHEETIEVGLALVDPGIEFQSRVAAVEGASYLGHEGARRYYADLEDTFRSWHNEPGEFEAVGEEIVICDTTFRGVGRDSGVEVALPSVIVFVFSGGKVIRLLARPTREQALEAAGLSE